MNARRLSIVGGLIVAALCATRGAARASCGWQVFNTPDAPQLTELTAVAVLSDSDVWTVVGGGDVEHWDGTTWTVTRLRAKRPVLGFSGIAMAAPDDGWIVGVDSDHPVIQHYDGTSWSRVKTPQGFGSLSAVTVLSPKDVYAAGWPALIEHFDGTQWRDVHRGTDTIFNGIAASGPNDIWAVGLHYGGSSAIYHWNGKHWHPVRHPGDHTFSYLKGVVALSPSNAWAVGYVSHPAYGPLIEHWDGRQWSRVKLDPSLTGLLLYGVAATAPNAIWAVGGIGSPGQVRKLFFDGHSWQNTAGINERYATLLGVATSPASGVPWVVGAYESDHTGLHPFAARETCAR